VNRASALTIALAATAALPATAAAATQTTTYRVVAAKGSQVVDFTANGDTCASFGTCGFGGKVTYKFSGTPSGRLVMKQNGRGHIAGAASFRTHGTTVSNITSGGACQDTVRHKREEFSLDSRSRLGKLLFGLHGGKTDYLLTDCAGPTENMLERDNALPSGRFKRSDFDSPSTGFKLRGTSNFRESGYVGTVTWKLQYRVRRG
jgi:hypothetical protein